MTTWRFFLWSKPLLSGGGLVLLCKVRSQSRHLEALRQVAGEEFKAISRIWKIGIDKANRTGYTVQLLTQVEVSPSKYTAHR